MLLIKLINNKPRHKFINNLTSAKCFGFVSHLQAERTIVVWTVCYNDLSALFKKCKRQSSTHRPIPNREEGTV